MNTDFNRKAAVSIHKWDFSLYILFCITTDVLLVLFIFHTGLVTFSLDHAETISYWMQILFIVSVLDLFHTHMNRFKDEKNTKEHWGKKN